MPRFCSSASFTASSIVRRRTISVDCCAAFCAAAASVVLSNRNCPLCAKADTDGSTSAHARTMIRRSRWK
ncbi:MAG: hypothetical protein DMG04_25975 [Acidobacteria bacterium]|nr:MAG: hypothetical protein DMG04_25975 [Acidobacteriota bacterium]